MFAQILILSPRRQRTAVGCIGVEGDRGGVSMTELEIRNFASYFESSCLDDLGVSKLTGVHGATPLSLDGLEWKIRK